LYATNGERITALEATVFVEGEAGDGDDGLGGVVEEECLAPAWMVRSFLDDPEKSGLL